MWAMIEKLRMRARSMAKDSRLPSSAGAARRPVAFAPCAGSVLKLSAAVVRRSSLRKSLTCGEHQEPEEAHPHRRQARRAEQGRQERAEDPFEEGGEGRRHR